MGTDKNDPSVDPSHPDQSVHHIASLNRSPNVQSRSVTPAIMRVNRFSSVRNVRLWRSPWLVQGGVTFFLYFQLFDIAALRFVSLRTKGKAAMLAVA